MHKTYTAFFTGKPNNAYRNLRFTSSLGQPITLAWNQHPHPSVTYYIYRIVKHNGVTGPQTLIATRGNSTTSYTDMEYTMASSPGDLIQYDVRAYYAPSITFADISYLSVYGNVFAKESDTTSLTKTINEDFTIANKPNPFNPSTNINFTIPKASNVKLTIYNMLGEKIKELFNGNLEAGTYVTQWNGDNQFGSKVISGIYLSVLQTNNKRIVQKMVLSK